MKTLLALCLMLTLAFAVSCKQETKETAVEPTEEATMADPADTLHSDEHGHDHSHEGHDHDHDH